MSRTAKARDRAVRVALEYERSTRFALRALNETDIEAQRAACLRWRTAVVAIEALTEDDFNRAGIFLTRRAQIHDGAEKLIAAALETFMAADAKQSGPLN
jgi:hypothetical protein